MPKALQNHVYATQNLSQLIITDTRMLLSHTGLVVQPVGLFTSLIANSITAAETRETTR